jgi:hypothetical protein
LVDGIHAYFDSGAAVVPPNYISFNKSLSNGGFDCADDTLGTGTSGTNNFWINDMGNTQNRPGLCKSHP